MREISLESQRQKIRDFTKGFKATHLINIGSKLGIFDALNDAKDGITVPDLASKLELHEPYLRIWCQTAYSFELLDCDSQGRFKLQPFLDEILGDRSHLHNYLGLFNLAVNVTGERLRNSPDFYRSGEIMRSYTPERSEIASEATAILHRLIGVYVSMIPDDDPLKRMLNQGARVLDIGCGAAGFIIQLAESFGSSTFLGVDPVPHGIEAAKTRIAQVGLEERVAVEHLGGEQLPYHDEFDIVTMILTFHEILPDVRGKVVEGAYQALRTDGLLLIVDFSYSDTLEGLRDEAYEAGVIDQFDETCLGVVHIDARQQNDMLGEIGFRDIRRISMQGIDVITAAK